MQPPCPFFISQVVKSNSWGCISTTSPVLSESDSIRFLVILWPRGLGFGVRCRTWSFGHERLLQDFCQCFGASLENRTLGFGDPLGLNVNYSVCVGGAAKRGPFAVKHHKTIAKLWHQFWVNRTLLDFCVWTANSGLLYQLLSVRVLQNMGFMLQNAWKALELAWRE